MRRLLLGLVMLLCLASAAQGGDQAPAQASPSVRLYVQSGGNYEAPDWGLWVRKPFERAKIEVRDYGETEPGEFEVRFEVEAWRSSMTGDCRYSVTWAVYPKGPDGKLGEGASGGESVQGECLGLKVRVLKPLIEERARAIAGAIRRVSS